MQMVEGLFEIFFWDFGHLGSILTFYAVNKQSWKLTSFILLIWRLNTTSSGNQVALDHISEKNALSVQTNINISVMWLPPHWAPTNERTTSSWTGRWSPSPLKHRCWHTRSHNLNRGSPAETHTLLDTLCLACVFVKALQTQPSVTHSLMYLRIYHKDVWMYTHTQSRPPTHVHTQFVRLQFPGALTVRDTQHPCIQGPCLSTRVIMVNSWACYPIAAYGSLISLLRYIKTARSDTLRWSLWSHTIFRLRTKAGIFCLRLQDRNSSQFFSNIQWIINGFILK